jgi:inosine/xanthosine triphosphatase
MKILVGSRNPVKIEAVREAFSKYFEDVDVIGIKVSSKVSNQPINDATFEGAKNRAVDLKRISKEKNLGAKFFVGIEGGVIKEYSRWFAFGGICIIDDKGRIGFGTSPHFELPINVTKELLNGTELGDVMDRITGEHHTKQKGGAIGYFTRGILDRKNLYVQGLVVALIPFINEKLYFE